MLVPSIAYGTLIGLVVGSIWALALDAAISTGLIFGGIGGLVVGFLLSILGEAVSSREKITRSESAFVAGSLLVTLGMISAGIGLIVWLIRVLFW